MERKNCKNKLLHYKLDSFGFDSSFPSNP